MFPQSRGKVECFFQPPAVKPELYGSKGTLPAGHREGVGFENPCYMKAGLAQPPCLAFLANVLQYS